MGFLGHMEPDPRLAVRVGETEFPSRIGLGWRVDPEQRATLGLSCFGAGCMEILADVRGEVRRGDGESLVDGGSTIRTKSESVPKLDRPLLRRYVTGAKGERVQLPSGVELPVVAFDDALLGEVGAFAAGIVLQVGLRESAGGWRVPAAMPESLPSRVRSWRDRLPGEAVIVVSGGVADPRDALALLDAGAELVLVDAGLVFRGPGLVKRCNAALLGQLPPADVRGGPVQTGFRRAWPWAAALGAAMAVGGLATLILAMTRVLLPYDENYLGLTSGLLKRNSPRLFAFMAHDRGTLAGTMLGLGWLYLVLAWRGIRAGVHGVRTAVLASALTGFASFFAFFGFGYFDTLHAFVAVVLFQITVQIMTGEEGVNEGSAPPVDMEDAIWRRAQWGQLFWVIHAVGLLIAGSVILVIGMTSVFVREDLAFLCLDAAQAQAFGERLIGVVAHDRATLGGMLLATGGADWLWWAMAGLGTPAYVVAVGVHLWVGYTDWRHLVPALAGLALWGGGLGLSRAYLRREETGRE